MKIVIDCANGAGYKSGPKLLRNLELKFLNLVPHQMDLI